MTAEKLDQPSHQASYERLHALGHAHSIECWMTDRLGDRRLVGGLYGVGFDRVFCGESMFSRTTDASKIALAWLVAALRQAAPPARLPVHHTAPRLAGGGGNPAEALSGLAEGRSERGAAGTAGLAAGVGDGAGTAVGEAEGAGAALALPEAFGALLAEAAGAGLSSSPGKLIAHFLTQTS